MRRENETCEGSCIGVERLVLSLLLWCCAALLKTNKPDKPQKFPGCPRWGEIVLGVRYRRYRPHPMREGSRTTPQLLTEAYVQVE
jgi:hypothetical protein